MTARITFIALAALLLQPLLALAEPDTALQDEARKLYASLNDEQRGKATLPFDSPERNKEVFPGGERAGVQIKSLSPEQQKLALSLLTAFCSDYGKDKALQIADQPPNGSDPTTGFERYYVCFFGEPGEGKSYAWRIAEHHLTLVHVEVEKGQATTFGPILLGANPPTLWDNEEQKMIALYAAMSAEERGKGARQGKGISAEPFKGSGLRVGDLSPSAKQAAAAVLENRLSFFSEPIQKRLREIIDSQGGVDAMKIAFWGEATRKCSDGGRWDFKMAGPSFLCDYEGSRAHIHMSMKGQLAAK